MVLIGEALTLYQKEVEKVRSLSHGTLVADLAQSMDHKHLKVAYKNHWVLGLENNLI